MSPRAAAICIPARNEAERLPMLLGSLLAQRIEASLRIVVVANNCNDGTVAVAEDFRRNHGRDDVEWDIVDVTLAPGDANVGHARRLAMDRGASWLERDGIADGVLLTTDADAIAPPNWVQANLAALKAAELVGGRLVMTPAETSPNVRIEELNRRIEAYWAGVRALEQAIDPPPYDPDPRHGDHTAASLALPVAFYRKVGGLPALPCEEDVALVGRVRWSGGRVRHCPSVSIMVSPRLAGRVEGGMASEMVRRFTIATEGRDYDTRSAHDWRRVFERRAGLRRAWMAFTRSGDPGLLAAVGLDRDEVAALDAAACPNDIAFVERAMAQPSQEIGDGPRVHLDVAIAEMEEIRRSREATRLVG